MQLVMVARVTFAAVRNRPEITIRKITAAHIETTWEQLTDTATVTIARNVTDFDKYNVKAVFQSGDPVKIELGYDNKFITEFQGYVTSVSADIPIVIKCEDEMYKLKRIPVNYSSPAAQLDTMLKAICPGYEVDALENVKLGAVRFAKTTVAKVLEKLSQDPFSLHSYMRGKKLVCGKYYADDAQALTHNFNLERNAVSNALNYRSKEAVLIKIKGTSVWAGGKKIEFELGEEGGDRLDLTYYNIQIKAELERLVRQDYDKRKVEGFDGSFTAFGIPSVAHGHKVNLSSSIYPDRKGLYYIKGVTKDFKDDATYRQEIKLDNAPAT